MRILLLFLLIISGTLSQAQTVSGILRDSETGRILVKAKVKSSIAETFSDLQGKFSIKVMKQDSLLFYQQGYQVLKINLYLDQPQKDLSIITLKPSYIAIEEVKVEGKTEKNDSTQIKIDLGIPKTPKYRQVVLGRADMSGNPRGFLANGSTARLFTVDLLAVKRMLFKSKVKIPLEEQLEADEYSIQYIDMTFSKELIEEMTGLKGDQATIFQNTYRPSYEEFSKMSDYELRAYIKNRFEEYKPSN
ncbi:MAG: carboxypeptidase-like regulatory domain-containing protein [Sphingobacterium mizutaii]|nr:carboxypeptidase-like regulatory domain-containing protein [Sphingobacterium mizutaii]